MLRQYLEKQQSALVSALNDPAIFPVGALSPQVSVRVAGGDSHFEWDSTRRNQTAFIRFTRLEEFPEYWVHVDFENYRSAFKRYLNRYFSVNPVDIGPAFHVDHMLNRAYAKSKGVGFVRLSLIPANQNIQYGASFEKRFLTARYGDEARDYYCPSYVTCMKALGIERPKNREQFEANKPNLIHALMGMGLAPQDYQTQEELIDGFFSWWSIIPD